MYLPPDPYWLRALLNDDCPGLDLTVDLLGLGAQRGVMTFAPKEDCVLSGADEAAWLLRDQGLAVTAAAANGARPHGGDVVLTARGPAADLHRCWKVCQTLMEYMSGIAGRTALMVERARTANPRVQVAVTRKNFPGAKRISLKAACCGGATVHRQGLSDSILIFAQHRAFLADNSIAALAASWEELRRQAPERKIAVEVDSPAEALLLAQAGADVIQCEKFPLPALEETVRALRAAAPAATILAAGGINGENAAACAATGVDVLVTTWPYFGRPADIKVVMRPEE